jgi:hypothetical protein
VIGPFIVERASALRKTALQKGCRLRRWPGWPTAAGLGSEAARGAVHCKGWPGEWVGMSSEVSWS